MKPSMQGLVEVYATERLKKVVIWMVARVMRAARVYLSHVSI